MPDILRFFDDGDGPFGEGATIEARWWLWPRWFHTNTGIGNTLGNWWPSRHGEHSAWILCDRCGIPFEIPSGLTIAFPTGLDEVAEIEWRGGPCTRCKEDGIIATGVPLLARQERDGLVIFGVSPKVVDLTREHMESGPLQAINQVLKELEGGELSLPEVISTLRSQGGVAARLSAWMENNPITASAAAMILAAMVQVAGQQITTAHTVQDPVDPEEQVSEILETVLSHYDKRTEKQRPTRSGDIKRQTERPPPNSASRD